MKYLCDKYPTCFKRDGDTIHNLITDKTYPVTGTDPVKLQEYLVGNIEEDFIILLKDPTREDEENGTEYFFKGGFLHLLQVLIQEIVSINHYHLFMVLFQVMNKN